MIFTIENLEKSLQENGSFTKAAKSLNIPRKSFTNIYYRAKKNGWVQYRPALQIDDDIIEQNIRLKKQAQKFQDINRVERKSWREYSRYENAIEDLSRCILDKLGNLEKPVITPVSFPNKGAFGIVHFSDWHLNECVDLDNNKYNWDIAGKRLAKYVHNCTQFFKSYNVQDILIINTGDTINNDSILDKILTNIDNRASAVVSAFDIFRQVILDFSKNFNISVVFCDANETRLSQEIGYSNQVASNNFDRTIYNLLQGYFADTPINFLGAGLEVLINFKSGINILACHGHTWKDSIEKAANKIISKYALDNINIDYICTGHIHSTYIGPYFSRSSSLVGNNSYNYSGLNINGRAGQNAIVFMPDKTRHAISIDLQNADEWSGYKVKEKAYNSQADDKRFKETTILKIVI